MAGEGGATVVIGEDEVVRSCCEPIDVPCGRIVAVGPAPSVLIGLRSTGSGELDRTVGGIVAGDGTERCIEAEGAGLGHIEGLIDRASVGIGDDNRIDARSDHVQVLRTGRETARTAPLVGVGCNTACRGHVDRTVAGAVANSGVNVGGRGDHGRCHQGDRRVELATMPIPDDELIGACGKARWVLHIEGSSRAVLPRIGVVRGTARHGDINAPIAVPRATDMCATGICEGHVRQGQRCRRSIDGDRECQVLRAPVRIGYGGYIIACRQARSRGAGLHRAGVPRDGVVAAAPGHHNGDGSVVIAEAGDVVAVRHGGR